MPPYVLPTATSGRTAVATKAATSGAVDAGARNATLSPTSTAVMPADDDWEGLVKRALLAERLVVYSDTARTLTSLANMMGAYPGLEATGRVMSGAALCAEMMEGVESGTAVADLVITSGEACVQALVRSGYVDAYVPTSVAPSLPDDMLHPVLTHHWEVVGLHHNDRLSDANALASWWDLVDPAWRGRVALADPLVDERAEGFLDTLIAHEEDLRGSYQGQLGANALAERPAWEVWLEALVANELVLLPSDAEVARWVGDPAAEEARAGFCSSAHWERVVRGDLDLHFALHSLPTAGVRWRTYVAPVAGASNPEGARLALVWLMGDDAGRGGYEPWYQAGLYPARLDVPLSDGTVPRSELVGRLWEVPALADVALRAEAIESLAGARPE